MFCQQGLARTVEYLNVAISSYKPESIFCPLVSGNRSLLHREPGQCETDWVLQPSAKLVLKMAYAPKASTSRGLARFQPTQGVYQSVHPTKLSRVSVTSVKAMQRRRTGKPTRTSLQCSAELNSQHEPSLLNDLTQVSGHPHLLLISNCSML